jgi:nitrogen regulatory protein P-II 1
VVKIEAVIRPERLEAVREKLRKIGYPGMMVTEMHGHGRQKGLHSDRSEESMRINFLPKTKIEIVVKKRDKAKVIDGIFSGARTGLMGDGKIFVSPVQEVYRVRTGEKGNKAL